MTTPVTLTPHPALLLFNTARKMIEEGELDAAAADAAAADAAMRAGPELDEATWAALTEARTALRNAAQAESTSLRSSMHQSGRARRAAVRYRPPAVTAPR